MFTSAKFNNYMYYRQQYIGDHHLPLSIDYYSATDSTNVWFILSATPFDYYSALQNRCHAQHCDGRQLSSVCE